MMENNRYDDDCDQCVGGIFSWFGLKWLVCGLAYLISKASHIVMFMLTEESLLKIQQTSDGLDETFITAVILLNFLHTTPFTFPRPCPPAKVIPVGALRNFSDLPKYHEVRDHFVDLKDALKGENLVLFISHTWEGGDVTHGRRKLHALNSLLREDTYIWMDQICINQNDAQEKRDTISNIQDIIYHCDQMLRLETPSYYRRCWCLFEAMKNSSFRELGLVVNPEGLIISLLFLILSFPFHLLQRTLYFWDVLQSGSTKIEDKRFIVRSVGLQWLTKLASPFLAVSVAVTVHKTQEWLLCMPVRAISFILFVYVNLSKRNRLLNEWVEDKNYGFLDSTPDMNSIRTWSQDWIAYADPPRLERFTCWKAAFGLHIQVPD